MVTSEPGVDFGVAALSPKYPTPPTRRTTRIKNTTAAAVVARLHARIERGTRKGPIVRSPIKEVPPHQGHS